MYFVTTDTRERRALFQSSSVAEIVETKLFEYRGNGHYFVHSYVVMPEHLHVILTPSETTTLEKAVQLIKGGSSHEIGARLRSKFPVWHPDSRSSRFAIKMISSPTFVILKQTPSRLGWQNGRSCICIAPRTGNTASTPGP